MPWCEECAKYSAPSAMGEGGECPSCGRPIEPDHRAKRLTAKSIDVKALASGTSGGEEDTARAPWHFKLLVVLLCVYLAWRFIQIFT